MPPTEKDRKRLSRMSQGFRERIMSSPTARKSIYVEDRRPGADPRKEIQKKVARATRKIQKEKGSAYGQVNRKKKADKDMRKPKPRPHPGWTTRRTLSKTHKKKGSITLYKNKRGK